MTNIATIINSIPTTTEIETALKDITVGCYTFVSGVPVARLALDIGNDETKPHWIVAGEQFQYCDFAAEWVQRQSIAREMAIM